MIYVLGFLFMDLGSRGDIAWYVMRRSRLRFDIDGAGTYFEGFCQDSSLI
jgi:hypothetical protein